MIIEGMLLYYYLVMETLHGKNVMSMTLERIVEAMIELLFCDRDLSSTLIRCQL